MSAPRREFDARHPLRVGLVGSGMMGFEHVRNLALQDEVLLVALADPHPPSRALGRRAAGRPVATYEDVGEMVEQERLDVVVVATPNHTHAAVLDALLDRPIHVLVEKPLCTTLEDCERIARAADTRDALLWVGLEYRYMPPVARLIELVRDGAVGRLRMLAIREHRFPFLPKVGDWNRFNRFTGGTLVEKCCHFFDLMNLIVGVPALRVYASGAQDVNHLEERYDGERPDILDNAYVLVDYEDGTRALLDLCMFAEGSRNEQEIAATGDLGKVECFVPESRVVVGRRADRAIEQTLVEVPEAILAAGFHHGATYYQQRAFLEAIRNPDAPRIDARAGLAATALGLAAQRSIECGAPVALAAPPTDVRAGP